MLALPVIVVFSFFILIFLFSYAVIFFCRHDARPPRFIVFRCLPHFPSRHVPRHASRIFSRYDTFYDDIIIEDAARRRSASYMLPSLQYASLY